MNFQIFFHKVIFQMVTSRPGLVQNHRSVAILWIHTVIWSDPIELEMAYSAKLVIHIQERRCGDTLLVLCRPKSRFINSMNGSETNFHWSNGLCCSCNYGFQKNSETFFGFIYLFKSIYLKHYFIFVVKSYQIDMIFTKWVCNIDAKIQKNTWIGKRSVALTCPLVRHSNRTTKFRPLVTN